MKLEQYTMEGSGRQLGETQCDMDLEVFEGRES